MQVLEVLAETPNQVALREQLVARVWPGVFVTDDVLHRAIRNCVACSATKPRTPPTSRPSASGYRLIAPVARPDTAAVTPITLSMQGPPTRTARSWMMIVGIARTRRRSWRRRLCVGAEAVADDPAPESVRFVAMTSGPLNETDPALSPDGNRLAFAMRPDPSDNGQPISTSPMVPAIRRSASPTMPPTIAIRRGQPMRRCSRSTHQRPHLRCDGDDARGSPGTSSVRAETSKNPVSVGRATANGSSNHSRLVPIPSAGGASRASRRGMACAKS